MILPNCFLQKKKIFLSIELNIIYIVLLELSHYELKCATTIRAIFSYRTNYLWLSFKIIFFLIFLSFSSFFFEIFRWTLVFVMSFFEHHKIDSEYSNEMLKSITMSPRRNDYNKNAFCLHCLRNKNRLFCIIILFVLCVVLSPAGILLGWDSILLLLYVCIITKHPRLGPENILQWRNEWNIIIIIWSISKWFWHFIRFNRHLCVLSWWTFKRRITLFLIDRRSRYVCAHPNTPFQMVFQLCEYAIFPWSIWWKQ